MSTYDDPEMIRVGTFRNTEGLNDLAQKGGIFYHTTDRKFRPGDAVSVDNATVPTTTNVRQGQVYREGNNVVYELMYGTAPSSAVLQAISNMLPADMRKKKIIIRQSVGKL
jgi:hypothetical protein